MARKVKCEIKYRQNKWVYCDYIVHIGTSISNTIMESVIIQNPFEWILIKNLNLRQCQSQICK